MKVILCDDSRVQRIYYENLIKKFAEKQQINLIINTYTSGEQLLFDFEEICNSCDIIFLDIFMNGMNGIQVAKELRKRNFDRQIVFLTSSKENMTAAFDVGAFHYIVKGETSIEKMEEIFGRAVASVQKEKTKSLTFSYNGESRRINLGLVRYFEVFDHSITVYYGEQNKFEFNATLASVVEKLPSNVFMRIHRSYVVNIDAISSLKSGHVILITGESLPVGRSYMDRVRQAVQSAYGLKLG